MKNIITVLCLILSTGVLVNAQDMANVTDKNETIAFNKKTIELDKVKIDIIKDDKSELTKIISKKPETSPHRQSSGNDYNKSEFFIGYSYQNIDRGDRQNFNGFNASYVRNVSRYIGLKGDVSGGYGSDSFSFTNTVGQDTFTLGTETKTQLYNFLGGVQFKDNASDKKITPFAHALIGAAHQRLEFTTTCSGDCGTILTGVQNFDSTHFSGAFGGGLDIKINDKIDFRAVQFDYNPIFPGGGVVNNFRVGAGIVFK